MDINTTSGQTITLDDAVFNCEYNEDLLHQLVTTYMTRGRAGTKRQKTRSEVSGGGIKPWRQKGTGRARAGTIRSPIWRSGGRTFAARPRDFTKMRLPKKMYRKGVRILWSELIRQDRVIVVSEIKIEQAKTKAFKAFMDQHNVSNVCVISDEVTNDLYLASRNLPNVSVNDIIGIDPVTLIKHDKVIITQAALQALQEKLQ